MKTKNVILISFASLMICFLLAGCKTKQQSETRTDIRETYSSEYLYGRVSGVTLSDSTLRMITRQFSGRITFWSVPDTAGQQHKVADMDFTSNTRDETKNNIHVAATDTISGFGKTEGEHTDKTQTVITKTADSRIINNNLLAWIVGISIGLALVIRLFRKSK